MKSNYKQLGEYIEIVSRVNSDLKYGIDDVRGCSNTKKMMQTRANLIGRTYEKFIVLKPQEFVFNRRTTRNGERIGMAYNDTDREYIFTNDYVAFRVKTECLSILLPEYLYLFFCRDEFDRYARYKSTGSATEFFNWEDMCAVPLEIPDIEFQKTIVKAYRIINQRIENKKKINDNLEAQAAAIYHSLFDEQSEWSKGYVSDFGEIVSGATPSKDVDDYFCTNGIVWLTPKDLTFSGRKFIYKGETDITDAAYRSCSTKMMPKGSVLLTSRAPVGCVAIAMTELCTNQGFKSIIPNKEIGTAFVYYFLKENKQLLESHSSGTTFMEISGNVLKEIPVTIPPTELTQKFTNICKPIFTHQEQLEAEIGQLNELQLIMLRQISNR